MIEFIKAILFGIVEGITEWLPVSSTGHLILLNEFLKLDVSEKFMEMFDVVIQLGAIFAVVLLFWKKIWPFGYKEKKIVIKKKIFVMWFKIVVACIPAVIVGLFFDDIMNELFYNPWTVAIMLIIVGIAFIIIENLNKEKNAKINHMTEITYALAFGIGMFQLIAAVFPGTSRSGATIIGGLILGMSRQLAAEFTFFLAIPVMLGASLLKVLKFGFAFSGLELGLLAAATITAFVVSYFIIRFLMDYIKKHDFKIFGYYRIILGVAVLIYFAIK